MNKKGQEGLGMIIVVAITLIVGVILFTAISQQVGTSTSTITVVNESIDTVVNGTAQYFTGYRALSDVVILNETGTTILLATNYTITNNVINPTTGALSVRIVPDATEIFKSAWRVSGTAQGTDYIADSGSRAVAGMIAIFFALAIAVVALTPTLRSNLLSALGR